MDYAAVVQALYERHRSVRDAGFSGAAYKPGLDAMLDYAAFLGHQERSFRCIHVAGTNGKGSVCSMLAAALAASGFRTGLYTSPHLVDFRERMKIIAPLSAGPDAAGAAEMIPEAAVCEFLERYDREGLTFFEVTTGMALWWFARSGVDYAVIETGLGGRLDSTNIITPEISIITSIGLDHCDLLGSTRAEIAAEKAGIFKPGVPALVWGRDPETQPVFERVASQTGSPLYYAEDYPVTESIGLDLTGPCQDQNLRTVLAALAVISSPRVLQRADCQRDAENRLRQTTQSVLANSLLANNLQITLGAAEADRVYTAIAHAAEITGFRGRWEQLLSDPLTICDIGHNPPALAANFARLEALRTGGVSGNAGEDTAKTCPDNTVAPGKRSLLIVYGAMADKDVDSIAGLMPEDAEYYLVQPDTPRAMPLGDLALKLKNLNCIPSGTVAQGVRAVLDRARELPGAIVYIGGSTFVVSEAISYFERI